MNNQSVIRTSRTSRRRASVCALVVEKYSREEKDGKRNQRNQRAASVEPARCAAPTGTMTGPRTGGDGGGEGGSPNILVALYVATAGLQGNALGSDEEEITLLVYVLINELQNKVTRSKEREIGRE